MKEGYIEQSKRKNVLLLTDDIRVHSGVAQIGREIVLNTAHRYNWIQLAGSIKHPDKGKVFDISEEVNKEMNIEDSFQKNKYKPSQSYIRLHESNMLDVLYE